MFGDGEFSLFLIILFSFLLTVVLCHDQCDANFKGSCDGDDLYDRISARRYLLYDVNPGEGFNLRRDVYLRIANLVQQLQQESSHGSWILVLPPWGPLYHWQSSNLGQQKKLPWKTFFSIHSLNQYVHVMEFEEFLAEYGPQIGVVYYLQHFAEGWRNNNWEERLEVRQCIDSHQYFADEDELYRGWFWGYGGVSAIDFHCLSVQGYASTLKPLILNMTHRAVMIDRAEVILHDRYGEKDYWDARRSMRFAQHLRDAGDVFRAKYLNSTDKADGTILADNWIDMRPKPGSARGGPYVAVHMRRKDFLHGRPSDVPSLSHAASQIQAIQLKLDLPTVFIATDAPENEFKDLKSLLPGAIRYTYTKKVLAEYKDGGIAIIDQWICAHARYFIGTHESTFSFRIQEEREILGFAPDVTFNRLCGDNQTTCEQPAQWKIVYN